MPKIPRIPEKTKFHVAGLNTIGRVDHRVWAAVPAQTLPLRLAGIPGDAHGGYTRNFLRSELPASQVGIAQSETPTPNGRQIIMVESWGMRRIARQLLDGQLIAQIEHKTRRSISHVIAGAVGANLLLKSTPDVSLNGVLMPSGRLEFGSAQEVDPNAGWITVTEYNADMRPPGASIVNAIGRLQVQPLSISSRELDEKFETAATNDRGWVGAVIKLGPVSVGQQVYIVPPELPPGTEHSTR